MKCVTCRHGETRRGAATVTLTRGGMTLIIKNVPAEVCANCGEEYVDEATTTRLMKVADEAARAGVGVDVREYTPI